MKYVYPAILYKDKKLPDTWTAIFPDVSGAITYGYSLYETLVMAEDALAGMMVKWEDTKAGRSKVPLNNKILPPTPVDKIRIEPDEYTENAFVTLIKTDTDSYRKHLTVVPSEPVEKTEGTEESETQERELPGTFVRELYKVAGIVS